MSADNSAEVQAVALELLSRRIVAPAVAVARYAGKAPERVTEELRLAAGGEADADGIWLEPLHKVAEAAAPSVRALLGAFTLTEASSGSEFEAISPAVDVLAASMAPVFLPAQFAVAAGLVVVSDAIWSNRKPALSGPEQMVLASAVPATRAFVDVVGRATEALAPLAERQLVKPKAGARAGEGSQAAKWADFAVQLADLLRPAPGGNAEVGPREVALARPEGRAKYAPSEFGQSGMNISARSPDPTVRVRARIVEELQLALGPGVGVGELGCTFRQAHVAALDMTPFQIKTLERIQEAVTELRKLTGNQTATGPGYLAPDGLGAGDRFERYGW